MAYLGNKKLMFSPQVAVLTPSKTSELENDSGFITEDEAKALGPTKTSELENDNGFITEEEVYTKGETAEILQTGKLTKINGTVALQTANFYDTTRPTPEAYMYFECNEKLVAGGRYRLAITGGSSGNAVSEIFIASAPPQDLDSNQISGCSFKEIESDMPEVDMVHTCTFSLPEDYPQPTPVYFVLCVEDDYIASLTEAPVVLEQLFEMGSSGELGDIETALDNIIAIQENLIGGDTV